ncbi:hypothetical protein E4U54_005801, partial [Claviceps lovelessii]
MLESRFRGSPAVNHDSSIVPLHDELTHKVTAIKSNPPTFPRGITRDEAPATP